MIYSETVGKTVVVLMCRINRTGPLKGSAMLKEHTLQSFKASYGWIVIFFYRTNL
jgi:hypothetical protein